MSTPTFAEGIDRRVRAFRSGIKRNYHNIQERGYVRVFVVSAILAVVMGVIISLSRQDNTSILSSILGQPIYEDRQLLSGSSLLPSIDVSVNVPKTLLSDRPHEFQINIFTTSTTPREGIVVRLREDSAELRFEDEIAIATTISVNEPLNEIFIGKMRQNFGGLEPVNFTLELTTDSGQVSESFVIAVSQWAGLRDIAVVFIAGIITFMVSSGIIVLLLEGWVKRNNN